MDFAQSHPFLADYLSYVENTESPRVFHVWAALSGISACLGRRCWLPDGLGNIWPNMFIALVGQPATRKGAAINISKKLLRMTTKVKLAPNDTGGQRQGIIRALLDTGSDKEDAELMAALSTSDGTETFGNISYSMDRSLEKLAALEFDSRDPHSMYAICNELNSFIGENNTAMLTFLQEMWDGGEYRYQLKKETDVLTDALLGLIAGTTPSQIALSMPQEAVGQGFTSRIIFVYADKSEKRIARPTIKLEMENELASVFGNAFHRMDGAFQESKAAADLMDTIYYRGVSIKDARFLHYCDRRGTHLKKLSIALAASRGSKIVEPIDVEIGDQLLLYTEKTMPDALGEYGMNKLGAAKQRLLDTIRNTSDAIPTAALFGMLSKDMTKTEFENAISDLHNTKKISVIANIPGLGQCVIGVDEKKSRAAKHELSQIEQLLKSA